MTLHRVRRVIGVVVIIAMSALGISGPAYARQEDGNLRIALQKQPPPGQQPPKGVAQPAKQKPKSKPARLPKEDQQALIDQQKQRTTEYRARLEDQERIAQQRSQALREQNRSAQYRYQQRYYNRIRQQRLNAQRYERYYNYNRDPYFYTPPTYRYVHGGTYYTTNQYGVSWLRQALNYGYQQGYEAGRADRYDHWNNGYEDCFAYQDANYGYRGYYIDQSEYNYYFREGFRRGYEDGYNSRYHYGHRVNGALILLASVLATILVVEAIHNE
jgi:hypothetical protein